MAAQENTPVTFTQEEQVELRNLNANLELFNLLKALLTQGSFPGSASVALVRCQGFADNIIAQTQKQIEEVQKNAASRSQDSGHSTSASEAKSSKKTSKDN